MKGYQVSNKLYIFPQTADTIPYVAPNVEVIYIQEGNLAEWKEENTTYADIMVKYNYNTMTIQAKEWAGHTNDDITYPTHNITVSSGADYITVASTAQYTSTVTVTPKAGYTTANVNVAAGDVQVTVGAESWTFTMPDADVTVAASIDTHTITLTGDTTYVSAPATSYAGQTVTVTPADLSNFDNITLTADGIEISKNDGNWTFIMPDENVSVAVAYAVSFNGLSVVYLVQDYTQEVALYTAPSGSSAEPGTSGDYTVPSHMWVDGVEETPAATWRFDSNGEHTVNYAFTGTNYLNVKFGGVPNIVSATIGTDITSINGVCWAIGESSTSQTYLMSTPPSITENESEYPPSGNIYVPAAAVDTYKAASKWSTIANKIFPIGYVPEL